MNTITKGYKMYSSKETTLDKVKVGDIMSGSGRAPLKVTRKTGSYVFYRWYQLPLQHGNFMINCPDQLAEISRSLGLKNVTTSGDMWNGSGKVPIKENQHILKLSTKEGKMKIHGKYRGVPRLNWEYVIPLKHASIDWDFWLG
jgi:hypothetical protein